MDLYDAYLHCGVSKYQPMAEVVRMHDGLNISRGLLVQHFGEYDNRYIIESAESQWPRYGVVVLLDPADGGWRAELAELSRQRVVLGLRVRVDGDNPMWPELARAAAAENLNVVFMFTYGCAGFESDFVNVIDDCPDTSFVVTHLGGSSKHFPGAEAVVFADRPNVYLQVSGFSMWKNLSRADFAGPLSKLVSSYGPSRVLWGSNYPVSPMREELGYIVTNPCELDDEGCRQVLWGTAASVWGARTSSD